MAVAKKIQECCGQQMRIKLETPIYYELHCRKCGDTIYVKKDRAPRPAVIDMD